MRRLAFDRTPPPLEALGRIRDACQDYDQQRGISVRYDELEPDETLDLAGTTG